AEIGRSASVEAYFLQGIELEYAIQGGIGIEVPNEADADIQYQRGRQVLKVIQPDGRLIAAAAAGRGNRNRQIVGLRPAIADLVRVVEGQFCLIAEIVVDLGVEELGRGASIKILL